MFTDFLLHLDTLGTQSDSAIVGLGGAFFSRTDPALTPREAYWAVSTESNSARTVCFETLLHWKDAAHYHDPFQRPAVHLEDALTELMTFFQKHALLRDTTVWTWTHRIEGTILQTAFEAYGIQPPWPYHAVWEGKTLCRACELYASPVPLPTPYGASPEQQMQRRIDAIIQAHGYFTLMAAA